MSDVELVAEYDHRVGEGPLWHPDEERLYWVDIPTGRLFRYDPIADESEVVLSIERALGGYTIQADGTFALFTGRGGVAVWDGPPGKLGADEVATDDDLEFVIDELPGEGSSRFNDVIADPEGRVFAGTMPTDDGPGTLYRVDPDGSYEVADDDGYSIPNGMGFTPGREGLYVTESEAHAIYLFDYDRATGALGNKRTFVETPAEEDIPDGMTVDEEGHVWSARWGGHCVVRHDPDGVDVDRYEVPAPKASSVTFGGPDYEDVYVTTAKGHDAEDPHPAGSVFRADVGVVGVPEFRSRVSVD